MAATTMMLTSTEVLEEAQRIGRYSKIEGEILALLKRLSWFPTAIKEIQNERTFPLFSKHAILKGILDLTQNFDND